MAKVFLIGLIIVCVLFVAFCFLALIHLLGIAVLNEARDTALYSVVRRTGYRHSLVDIYPDGLLSNAIALLVGLVVAALALLAVFLLGAIAVGLGLG